MNTPATLRYRAGQRKRTLVGHIKEVSEAGGVKCFKIQKRTKLSWINEKDVVDSKVETKESPVGGDERRDQTKDGYAITGTISHEIPKDLGFEIIEHPKETTVFQTTPIENAQPFGGGWKPTKVEADSESLQSQSQATEGIRNPAPELAQGEALRVLWDQSSGESDMFPGIASSARGASRRRTNPLPVKSDRMVGRIMCSCASVDNEPSEGSEKARIDPGQLERDESEFWKRQPAELANWKKRVCRAARNGISLREFAPNIAARAIVNDIGFFKRLAKAIEARKKKPK